MIHIRQLETRQNVLCVKWYLTIYCVQKWFIKISHWWGVPQCHHTLEQELFPKWLCLLCTWRILYKTYICIEGRSCSYENRSKPLVVLCGKLVHPAKFGVAVFAVHIPVAKQNIRSHPLFTNKILGHIPLFHITSPNHVPAGEHHSILHFAVLEVDHLVEQEGAPGGSSEPWVNIMMVRSVLQWLAVLWMSHLVEISSSLLVRTVSHEAQENRRVPPMCWMKIRPILTSHKQNHTDIRIGIQSQLAEGYCYLLWKGSRWDTQSS